MELRLLLKLPELDEPNGTPAEGLVWYENGYMRYQVKLQYRNAFGWQDVPTDYESR